MAVLVLVGSINRPTNVFFFVAIKKQCSEAPQSCLLVFFVYLVERICRILLYMNEWTNRRNDPKAIHQIWERTKRTIGMTSYLRDRRPCCNWEKICKLHIYIYALADNTYLLIPPFQYTQIILVQFNCGFLCKPINLCLCKCEFPYRICLIIIIIFCCGSGKWSTQ